MDTNYTLLDTGNGRRLEAFGDVIVNRIAKQADWETAYEKEIWDRADLYFDGKNWLGNTDKEFTCNFDDIKFNLKALENGQVGIFPDQLQNWTWLKRIINERAEPMNIINGFAYTGGSTLFSSTDNTDVCHLEGSKASINRAKLNAGISDKAGNSIRWMCEDVITFLQKEVKRGKIYNGFIFDPPAFGRGGKGKVWKLKKDLPILMDLINQLSAGQPEFVLFTAHDPELPDYKLAKMVGELDGVDRNKVEKANLVISAESGNHLANGYFARWSKEIG